MNSIEARTGRLAWDGFGNPGDHGLVLIHSLGQDSRMWSDQLQAFAESRRVVTVDLPGHGASEAADREYSIDDLGMDIAAVADAADLDTFDLCGISIGGMVALWLAINLPDRVTRLVASNTAGQIGTAQGWNERIEAVTRGGMSSIEDAVVPRFVTPELADRRPQVMDLLHEMFGAVDPVGYAGCCAALRDADLRDALGRIACPTLVIGGERDIATTPEVVRGLHESIPGSRLQLIADAAHLPNLDQPAEFTRIVVDWLAADESSV